MTQLCRMRFGGLLLAAAASLAAPASGQPGRVLPVEDPAYVWIGRLLDRGYLAGLDPGALPYTHAEVRAAVAADLAPFAPARRAAASAERAPSPSARRGVAPATSGHRTHDPVAERWLTLLAERVDSSAAGLSADPGLKASTSRRFDALREFKSVPHAYPNVLLTAWAGAGPFTIEASARADAYYDLDPDGLDTALRAFSRSENTYVGFERGAFSAHVGRFSEHWGLPGSPGLVLSSNPRTIDALRLRVRGRRISLRSFFGELDATTPDGRFTGAAGADSVGGLERRWLAAHRLDWRVSDRVSVFLAESVLFSGPGAGFSLKFMNPVQPAVLETDNLPKNDENNGLLAVGFHARAPGVTWAGQFVVDDFDFLHADERASFSAWLRALRPGVASGPDVGLEATLVSSRAYNTVQPEGRYMHLLRGLATQFSDFVEVAAFARWYMDRAVRGLAIEPRLTGLWQGEGDLRLPYPTDSDRTLLIGRVERTVRASARLSYEPDSRFMLQLDVGVRRIDASRVRFSATGSVSYRFATSGPSPIDR